VRLVGFIVRIYHDVRSPERQKKGTVHSVGIKVASDVAAGRRDKTIHLSWTSTSQSAWLWFCIVAIFIALKRYSVSSMYTNINAQ